MHLIDGSFACTFSIILSHIAPSNITIVSVYSLFSSMAQGKDRQEQELSRNAIDIAQETSPQCTSELVTNVSGTQNTTLYRQNMHDRPPNPANATSTLWRPPGYHPPIQEEGDNHHDNPPNRPPGYRPPIQDTESQTS